ncbi:MAG: Uma2 family endonuclease [Acidobacteria bacterium]|nr:Uma2 family endonuclease [Acidobacteriota bacterium]
MTASAPKPLITADELPAISARHSARGQRTELVGGDLIVMAPAGGRHGQVAHALALFIGTHVRDRNLGRVFAAETGFLLRRDPDTVRAPDVAFVADERLGARGAPAGFLEMAPDLAAEVVSPGDSAAAVRDKAAEWLAAGTRLVWVVYPETRSVVVHRPDHPARALHDAETLEGGPVFTDFSVRVGDLFT